MIISGEGEGPLEPMPIQKGILLFGWNAVAFNTVISDIKGFNYKKIPSIYECYGQQTLPLVGFAAEDIDINVDFKCNEKLNIRSFTPLLGWKGHIEKKL